MHWGTWLKPHNHTIYAYHILYIYHISMILLVGPIHIRIRIQLNRVYTVTYTIWLES